MLISACNSTVTEGRSEGPKKNGQRHGNWKSYYFSGSIQEEGRYRKGKKEGLWITYSEDGSKIESVEYKNDLLHGSKKTFHPDGSPKCQLNYSNNLPVGEYKCFDLKGNLEQEGNYEAGIRQGIFRTYYRDGSFKEVQTWNNGQASCHGFHQNAKAAYQGQLKMTAGSEPSRDALWQFYNEQGHLLYETYYRSGKYYSGDRHDL
jgi:antitoxin component YwqK of YwqJK toxin-antitoxin module